MNMQTGLNYAAKFVLYLSQVFRKTTLAMRVDKSYDAHSFALHIAHPLEMDDIVSYGISYAF
jgi:hypothetical protein